MKYSTIIRNFVLLALVANFSLAHAAYVWIEAETPDSKVQAQQSGWLKPQGEEQIKKFSGGDWLHFSPCPDNVRLQYSFTLRGKSEYSVFVRRFYNHGDFHWRIDGGDWRTTSPGVQLIDSVSIKEHVSINWSPLGTVTLHGGQHVLEIKTVTGTNQAALALDCFCITDGLFLPRGHLKPGQRTGKAMDGYWAFEAAGDSFAPGCMLDLSYLNEDVAGETGRVSYADGDFLRGDGQEIRFWGVGVNPFGKSLAQLRYQAKRLARLGVNHVRLHVNIESRQDGSDLTDVNKSVIEHAHRLVAAMREEGIYTMISPLFALRLKIQPSWGVPGYSEGDQQDRPFGLLFYDPTLQRGYKAWIKEFLTRENPYTKIPLAQDPAMHVFQIQNEDSNFFWTFLGTLPQVQRDALGKKFGTWLIAKYGSLDEAMKLFGDGPLVAGRGGALVSDDTTVGMAGIMGAWSMTSRNKSSNSRRIADQISFLSELQYDFNADIAKWLRDECGYDGLVNAGNWRTCDDDVLLDLERWTYTACDVIDVHSYFNSTHINPKVARRASYQVAAGDFFTNASILKNPYDSPTSIRCISGLPYTVSENTWPQPNKYKAEAPLFVAAYSRLVGLDGFLWFSSEGLDYENSITKFQVNMPSIMGQFPAAALMYRGDYLKEGPVVVAERRLLDDIYARKKAALPEGTRFDPNRDAKVTADNRDRDAIDPLAYYVGKVTVDYLKRGRSSVKARSMNKFIKRSSDGSATVRSATGQQILDTGRGVLIVSSDSAVGICGFLGAASTGGGLSGVAGVAGVELGPCIVRCENDFASIMIVAMDGRPLVSSQRILVQAMTEDRPYGWREHTGSHTQKRGDNERELDGYFIDSLGTSPWNVRDIKAEIALPDLPLTKATVLDEYGYPREQLKLQRRDGRLWLKLPKDSLYTILE